jgi:hypothetical protein
MSLYGSPLFTHKNIFLLFFTLYTSAFFTLYLAGMDMKNKKAKDDLY